MQCRQQHQHHLPGPADCGTASRRGESCSWGRSSLQIGIPQVSGLLWLPHVCAPVHHDPPKRCQRPSVGHEECLKSCDIVDRRTIKMAPKLWCLQGDQAARMKEHYDKSKGNTKINSQLTLHIFFNVCFIIKTYVKSFFSVSARWTLYVWSPVLHIKPLCQWS